MPATIRAHTAGTRVRRIPAPSWAFGCARLPHILAIKTRKGPGGRSPRGSFCFNWERRMIDNISISVGSIARATEFYLKALAPLGYGIVIEVSAEETDHGAAIASPAPGRQPTSKAANRPSGLVRAQRRAGHCMSPSWLRAVPPSMFSIMPRSRRGRRQRRAGAQAPLPRPTITPSTATISKPYATALNESRRTRPPGGELMNCLLRPATAGDLASNLVAMSAVGSKRTCKPR